MHIHSLSYTVPLIYLPEAELAKLNLGLMGKKA